MSRHAFTRAEKITIADGWAQARADGESQQAYAARVGVSARRVREFVEENGFPIAPIAEARQVVLDAIETLQRLLARLDVRAPVAPAEPARRSAARDGGSTHHGTPLVHPASSVAASVTVNSRIEEQTASCVAPSNDQAHATSSASSGERPDNSLSSAQPARRHWERLMKEAGLIGGE